MRQGHSLRGTTQVRRHDMNSHNEPEPREIDRRTLLRWGAFVAGGLGVSGLTAACSSGVSSSDTNSSGGGTGSPTKTQPKAKFRATSNAGTKSPLSPQLGMALVTLQGATQQFADAATTTAKQHQLGVSQATNDGNTGKAISQMNNFIQRQVGALFVQDLTPSAQVPVIKKAIDQGIATFAFNMPANMQLTASQYNVGKQLAQGTLDYISKHMNNKAELVH